MKKYWIGFIVSAIICITSCVLSIIFSLAVGSYGAFFLLGLLAGIPLFIFVSLIDDEDEDKKEYRRSVVKDISETKVDTTALNIIGWSKHHRH